MNKPLVIYLDSNDYSVFSNDSARSPEIINVENQLLKLRDEGKIEIRYSYINVIEAAPIANEFISSAYKRLKKIQEICRYKCLASHHSVLENEINSLATSEKLTTSNFSIFNDNGIWFPSLIVHNEICNIQNDIKSEISKLSDRESRRKAEKRVFNADGTIKKNIQSLLNNSCTNAANSICSEYPISPYDAKLAVESYIRTGSMNEFMKVVSNSLANLDNLASWYEQSWDQITPLSSYFREEGFHFKTLLDKVKSDFVQLNSNSSIATQDNKQITKSHDQFLNSLLISLPKLLANKFSENMELNLKHDANWNLSPSLLTLTRLAAYLAKHIISTQRNSKTSDYGDIFHLIYLPHVDIFRADANTASIISQAKLPIKTKVVAKLIDLPNEIHNSLLLKN